MLLLHSFAEEAFGVCQSSEGNVERIRLTGSSGTLFSPFYPTPYPKNVTCIWVISAPANKRVELTFDKFDLNREDNVRILDGRKSSSEEVAVYHGYNLFSSESAVYSSGRYMRIKFHSSLASWYSTGFKAHFETVDPRKYIMILFINRPMIFKSKAFSLACSMYLICCEKVRAKLDLSLILACLVLRCAFHINFGFK